MPLLYLSLQFHFAEKWNHIIENQCRYEVHGEYKQAASIHIFSLHAAVITSDQLCIQGAKSWL